MKIYGLTLRNWICEKLVNNYSRNALRTFAVLRLLAVIPFLFPLKEAGIKLFIFAALHSVAALHSSRGLPVRANIIVLLIPSAVQFLISGIPQVKNQLFIQWNGTQMHPSTPYHVFRKIISRYNAALPEGEEPLPPIPLHGLRHTSATLLISQNVDVRTVSSRLGHAQTSITMNIYAHSLKKTDEKSADTLESLLIKSY